MGSPPSWPFMDFNNPLSSLLQEDLQPPHTASPPPPSLPSLLSSPASLGASTAKVSKRKSRAVCKPPIRVLSADRESFRDMVQKLTGIPTSPVSLQAGRLWDAANSTSALLRPLATRPGGYKGEFSANGSGVMAHQSMPTLDTSSAYLTRAFSNNSTLVYNEVGNARFKANLYEAGGYRAAEATRAAGVALAGGPYAERPYQGIEEMSEVESFLMGSNKLEELLQARIDPWLTPQLEIAHSA